MGDSRSPKPVETLRDETSRAHLVEENGVEEGVRVEIQDDREKWGTKADFLLSCIGYAVGLGNVWRFPYLCYQNGGATFLIPYFLMLAVNGIPLFYMELAIGQYLSLGTVGAWSAICPVARGIGFAMIMVSFLVSIYYNVIIAWCLLFLFESMKADVPWKNCGQEWNTPLCMKNRFNMSKANCTLLGVAAGCKYRSPSEEFFQEHILQLTNSINNMGSFSWQITLCLILAWVFVYLCLLKGVKSSGKDHDNMDSIRTIWTKWCLPERANFAGLLTNQRRKPFFHGGQSKLCP